MSSGGITSFTQPARAAVIALAVMAATACGGKRRGTTESGAIVISGAPTCEECEITLEPIASLGGPSDPTSVRTDAMVEGCGVGRLAGGDFVVASLVGGGPLLVYAPDGSLRRTIGRNGAGPGEFGPDRRFTVGPGDTLTVIDETNARVEFITALGEHLRSFPLPGRTGQFSRLPDGSILLHRKPSGLPGPDAPPLFHRYDAQGVELGTFGLSTFEPAELDHWLVTAGHASGFWTGSLWRYEIYRRTAIDSPVLTVRRDVEWFPPDGAYRDDMHVRTPPPPNLIAVREDREGRLWTYSIVPDPDWKPGDIPRGLPPSWWRASFDTMIEVLDLEEGTAVAQLRYDDWIGAVCNSNVIYTVTEAESGDTRMNLFEPVMR